MVISGWRDQLVHQLLEVLDAARLVLDQGDRGGRVRHEDVHDPVADPGGLDDLLDPAGDVDDVPVTLRGDADLGAVDGHGGEGYAELPRAIR